VIPTRPTGFYTREFREQTFSIYRMVRTQELTRIGWARLWRSRRHQRDKCGVFRKVARSLH
jgi:hypothetical protein